MNSYGVLTTEEEIMEMEPECYITPKEEGEFEFDIDFRTWYKYGQGLICYGHDYSQHRFIKLFAWRRPVNGEMIYAPKGTDIDMSKVKDGSLWKVTLGKTKRGKVEWKTAEFIEDIDEGIEDEKI